MQSEIYQLNPDEGASESAHPGYWYELIPEKPAGVFLDLSPRTMQDLRYRGGGPKYVGVSARSIKYRRVDLRVWSEQRLRNSTSDQNAEATA